ncbi:hypothetical protein Atai01_78690 [Amycolatopsis taiwanensis]|uniref:Uncharacterized protein n=1 Tax=Amycolatopsis taiwanensis TaxID=342230 RepID=A0A9W6RAM5_9PSEU|nr:hypothetical protein Atai01_78690 [Amycolatopsis taiwanensis]
MTAECVRKFPNGAPLALMWRLLNGSSYCKQGEEPVSDLLLTVIVRMICVTGESPSHQETGGLRATPSLTLSYPTAPMSLPRR